MITMILSPYLCYSDNQIRVSVKNTGEPVESVTLRVSDDLVDTDIKLRDSKLGEGGKLSKDIPFVRSGKTRVALIPSIKFRDRIVECDQPALEIDDLPDC